MRPNRRWAWLAAGLAALTASACVGASETAAGSPSAVGASVAGTASTSPAASGSASVSASAASSGNQTETLDRARFSRSTVVDNRWFPLKPGTQLVFKGASTVDGERLGHDVVFTVTDLVKEVDGVRNVVVYELDYTEGVLNEAELAFFAQADDGTVWHLGQYPEVYEDGRMVEAPAWISGQQGAAAGITMKADPRLGQSDYSQGWGPAVDWKDRARLARTGQRTCVPAGCYSGVLVTEEFVVDEPDAFQLKYYAPGVGNVRVGWAGAKDQDKEELQLVATHSLDAAARAKVRAAALALETHAYQVSKDVYATTTPMQVAPAT